MLASKKAPKSGFEFGAPFETDSITDAYIDK
jgi:hypothetical protein